MNAEIPATATIPTMENVAATAPVLLKKLLLLDALLAASEVSAGMSDEVALEVRPWMFVWMMRVDEECVELSGDVTTKVF